MANPNQNQQPNQDSPSREKNREDQGGKRNPRDREKEYPGENRDEEKRSGNR